MSYPHKEQVFSLAALGLSDSDIAALTELSESDLTLHYDKQLAAGRATMRRDIVSVQLDLAINERDRGMLIHLGKTLCGQNEKFEHNVQAETIVVQNFGDGELKPHVSQEFIPPLVASPATKSFNKGFQSIEPEFNEIVGSREWKEDN